MVKIIKRSKPKVLILRKKKSAKVKILAKKKKKVKSFDPTRLKWKSPYEKTTECGLWTVWWTTCKRYRIVRSLPRFGNAWEPRFVACFGKSVLLGEGKSLLWAMEKCARHGNVMNTNEKQIIEEAEKLQIDSFLEKKSEPEPVKEKKKIVILKRKKKKTVILFRKKKKKQ